MYNSQEISLRIKDRAKQKNVSINQMLLKCELGKNTITKMSNGTDILTQNFAKIADYLDCSVDYLLGRTDNPKNQSITNNVSGSINGSNNNNNFTVTNLSSVNINNSEYQLSDEAIEMFHIYESLDLKKRHQVLDLLFKLEDEMKESEKDKN